MCDLFEFLIKARDRRLYLLSFEHEIFALRHFRESQYAKMATALLCITRARSINLCSTILGTIRWHNLLLVSIDNLFVVNLCGKVDDR